MDYVTDTPYPPHFFRETMPLWMSSVLTALGRRAPDVARPYVWMELGCGQGLGVLVAAATNPLGTFIGVDLDPAAIAAAQDLADRAGVRNARFLCLDFGQAATASRQDIPACDFIVAHGVYSWLDAVQRQALHALVSQRLSPGGVLYLGYLCQPGSASFAAVQRMLWLNSHRQPSGSTAKARQAIALLHGMAEAGLGYFQDTPNALANIPPAGGLDDRSAAYFAHDYLSGHWEALHVSDVMADCAAAGCEFAGSAAPYENIDTASLPEGAQVLLAGLREQGAPSAEVETFKDLARNQISRYDLYQRSHPEGNWLTEQARREALLAQRVCLVPGAPAGPAATRGTLNFQSRIGPIRLPAQHVAPLLDALQAGALSYAELARLPAYADQPGAINTLLQMLAWAGWLQFLRPDAPFGTSRQDAAMGTAQQLNRALARWPTPYNGAIQAHAGMGSAFAVPNGSVTEQQLRRMTRNP